VNWSRLDLLILFTVGKRCIPAFAENLKKHVPKVLEKMGLLFFKQAWDEAGPSTPVALPPRCL
jgi:hypothetical protein